MPAYHAAMWQVGAVTAGDTWAVAAAQELFRQYGGFLHGLGDHANFDSTQFSNEIESLPAAYPAPQGGVLVAVRSGPVEAAGGCIAFRAKAGDEATCEVKRLFVAEGCRGEGVGELLVRETLVRAKALGYRWAVLDTEPTRMATAHRMYVKAGFTEYDRRELPDGGPLVFLRKAI